MPIEISFRATGFRTSMMFLNNSQRSTPLEVNCQSVFFNSLYEVKFIDLIIDN